MAEQQRIIKKYPKDIVTVSGHTDNSGSELTNQQLSEARASAVRAILISSGVPAASVSAVGMGPSSPIADNSTATGKAQNRRVEIGITVQE